MLIVMSDTYIHILYDQPHPKPGRNLHKQNLLDDTLSLTTYLHIPLLVHVLIVSLYTLLERPVTYKPSLHPCTETHQYSSQMDVTLFSVYLPTLACPDTVQEVHSYVPAVFLHTPLETDVLVQV